MLATNCIYISRVNYHYHPILRNESIKVFAHIFKMKTLNVCAFRCNIYVQCTDMKLCSREYSKCNSSCIFIREGNE